MRLNFVHLYAIFIAEISGLLVEGREFLCDNSTLYPSEYEARQLALETDISYTCLFCDSANSAFWWHLTSVLVAALKWWNVWVNIGAFAWRQIRRREGTNIPTCTGRDKWWHGRDAAEHSCNTLSLRGFSIRVQYLATCLTWRVTRYCRCWVWYHNAAHKWVTG